MFNNYSYFPMTLQILIFYSHKIDNTQLCRIFYGFQNSNHFHWMCHWTVSSQFYLSFYFCMWRYARSVESNLKGTEITEKNRIISQLNAILATLINGEKTDSHHKLNASYCMCQLLHNLCILLFIIIRFNLLSPQLLPVSNQKKCVQ